jgi:hypothetical protein
LSLIPPTQDEIWQFIDDINIWTSNPEIKDAWLCAKCYARGYYAPKKKFKTKEERYEYMSKLFRGDGNIMYDVHFFGRTYTPERNEKVSQAVKKWASLHPEQENWNKGCSEGT